MGFRITTNMMMNTYRYNLQNSTLKLSNARDMVLTQRQFNSYADDPAAATQEFRLRRDYYTTYSQRNNTKNAYSKYNTAWNNLAEVKKKLINETTIQSAIRGDNGTTGEARRALATTLRETSESLIYAMNQKLGDQFIFAGNDGLNVPFEWKGEDLYYRGINVKAGGLVDKPLATEPNWLDTAKTGAENGTLSDGDQAWYDYYTHATNVKPDATKYPEPNWLDNATPAPGSTDEAWLKYYKHEAADPPVEPKLKEILDQASGRTDPPGADWTKTDEAWYQYLSGASGESPEAGTRPDWVVELTKTDTTKLDDTQKACYSFFKDKDNYMYLKEMGDEKLYIDLGMGLAENSPNNAVNGSYFNSALCGIAFTGFGVDEDGDPKNLALIMREFADIFQAWDESMDPQGYNPALAGESAKGLTSAEMEQKAFRLLDKLKASQENFTEKWVELDAKSVFLTSNQERLETLMIDTNTEILDISQVDLAEAITTFSWQQYCYNAALKIGNQLLSQSLIDYMG